MDLYTVIGEACRFVCDHATAITQCTSNLHTGDVRKFLMIGLCNFALADDGAVKPARFRSDIYEVSAFVDVI
jgi:hypothetical protein